MLAARDEQDPEAAPDRYGALEEGLDFVGRSKEVGFRQAVRERDDPFGDYGSRPTP